MPVFVLASINYNLDYAVARAQGPGEEPLVGGYGREISENRTSRWALERIWVTYLRICKTMNILIPLKYVFFFPRIFVLCVSVELDFSVWSRKILFWFSTPRRLFYRHENHRVEILTGYTTSSLGTKVVSSLWLAYGFPATTPSSGQSEFGMSFCV